MWCKAKMSDVKFEIFAEMPFFIMAYIIMATCDAMTVDLSLFDDSTVVENVPLNYVWYVQIS